MADDGLDGGAASHLTFDLEGYAALLLGHLGSVQAVDLGAALAAFLIAHPPCQAQQGGRLVPQDGDRFLLVPAAAVSLGFLPAVLLPSSPLTRRYLRPEAFRSSTA
jgi:hypothetical protein